MGELSRKATVDLLMISSYLRINYLVGAPPLLQTIRMPVGVGIAVFDYKSTLYEEMHPILKNVC